ncbi:hypothetical protein NMY22_g6068 [Coprinellus aureogranulatus]|nr:hypothetical protein NMY22_g6068 [Coprinellus aureogranulatus]
MLGDGRRGRSTEPRQDVRVSTRPSIVTFDDRRIADDSTSKFTIDTTKWQRRLGLSNRLGWVKANWNWSSIKPVIRCAIAAWIAAVIFAIPAVESWMGVVSVSGMSVSDVLNGVKAAFLILIGSFLSPPSDPFVAVLERELLIILFVCIAWAWSCLGLKFASMARRHIDYSATFMDVIDGKYIEAAPSVIAGVFIALGSMFFLYIKARKGPGPYLFASIFGCICIDINLTTAVLFPYPYYQIGQTIVIPLGLHSCIAVLMSLIVFPQTISAQFASRIQAFYAPLASLFQQHATLLQSTTGTTEFEDLVAVVVETMNKGEDTLVSAAAAGRLLSSDLTFCRFSPSDFRAFQGFARRLIGRLNGMGLYFRLINPEKDKFYSVPPSAVNTPGHLTPVMTRSRHPSPTPSGSRSRHHSPSGPRSRRPSPDRGSPIERSSPGGKGESSTPPQLSPSGSRSQLPPMLKPTRTPSGQGSHHRRDHPQHHLFHLHLHNSLMNLSLKSHRHRRAEKVVGVFESQKYLNLEAKRTDPRDDEWIQTETELLGKGCVPLLEKCSEAFKTIDEWFAGVRRGKWSFFSRQKQAAERAKKVEKIKDMRSAVASALETFHQKDRLLVIEPYHPVVELNDDESVHKEIPPHRHLFHCYVYQYHLIQVASIVIESLDEILRLEKERPTLKLWTPVQNLFAASSRDVAENLQHADDDDPDVIQGAYEMHDPSDLGLPRRRDPDALPPRNWVESAMNLIYHLANSLSHGNCLFAIKAGLVSAVLCLPFLIRNSAEFAYYNRYVWAIIMGQLTIARFRGDTTFGLAARIMATFVGGVIGMVLWYISSGKGAASPYAFLAVCAVSFPPFFMVVLYCPIPPMTRLVMFVTAILVLCYSYQDTHQVVPGSPGFGWDVAWRRFVLVTIGVVAAFIASLLPPTMTLRRYQRSILATTCTEIGAIYCSIVSFATEKKEASIQEIASTLLATRNKLKRASTLSTNIVYEFSLRGRWPKKRYQQILDLQIAVTYSLSHLLSVMEHLEPSWTRAFLRRTRFIDADFQGDVLAVISMISSSLRTGNPLPQVTPCPLLDRFMMRYHGLDVIHRDSEDDYGLPRLLTLETLQNEQYMMFCVGISTAYSLMNRLDRLMLAAKEIVGEQYHIHGVGIGTQGGASIFSPGYQGYPLSPSCLQMEQQKKLEAQVLDGIYTTPVRCHIGSAHRGRAIAEIEEGFP